MPQSYADCAGWTAARAAADFHSAFGRAGMFNGGIWPNAPTQGTQPEVAQEFRRRLIAMGHCKAGDMPGNIVDAASLLEYCRKLGIPVPG